MKKAFTMIELILVIVIMSIVGLITLEVLFAVYANYSQSKAINSLETQTEITLEQISKRLGYRIKPSVIARKQNITDFISLGNIDKDINGANYHILEFIPYAYEFFNAGAYSGFIDLDDTDKATLKTPGSKLYKISDGMYKDLTNKNYDHNQRQLAIIFKDLHYDKDSFGYNAGKHELFLPDITGDEKLEIRNSISKGKISEQYHLAYTANALVPENFNKKGDFTLMLYYNYRPWLGEKFSQGQKAVMATNVTSFNFKDQNDVVILKLCLHDAGKSGLIMTKNYDVTICKSKAVY